MDSDMGRSVIEVKTDPNAIRGSKSAGRAGVLIPWGSQHMGIRAC